MEMTTEQYLHQLSGQVVALARMCSKLLVTHPNRAFIIRDMRKFSEEISKQNLSGDKENYKHGINSIVEGWVSDLDTFLRLQQHSIPKPGEHDHEN